MIPQRITDFLRKQSVMNAGALFSGSSLARILSAVYIFILARHLGVENFGLYAANLSLAKLTAVFVSLGLDSWLLRNGQRDPANFDAAVGNNLFLKLLFGLVWLVLLGGVSLALDQTVFPFMVMAAAALAVWAEEIANTAWSAFKAKLHNQITVWLLVGAQLAVLSIMALLILMGAEDAHSFMLGRMVAFLAAALVSFYWVIKRFGLRLKLGQLRQILAETAPFGLSHGLATIYSRADITIIAYALGSAAAGLYAPAVSLMTTLFLIPLTLYEVALPLISAAHTAGRSLRQQIIRFSWISVGLGALLSLVMLLLAHPLIWFIYGPEFAEAGNVLIVLSGIVILKCISFALAAALAGVGWQGRRVWAQAVTTVVSVGLTVALVRPLGIIGVAYIYVFTEFLLMVGYLWLVYLWLRDHDAAPQPALVAEHDQNLDR
jgi:O-antigen/teichoic acid export membrane protein